MDKTTRQVGESIIPPNTKRDCRFSDEKREKVLELSPRQIQICKLVAQGMSSKEVALLLGVTPQNVSDVRNSEKGKALINDFLSFSVGKAASESSPLENIIGDAHKIIGEVVNPKNLENGALPLDMVVRTALEVTKKSIPSTVNTYSRTEEVILGARMISQIKERSSLARMVRENAEVINDENA